MVATQSTSSRRLMTQLSNSVEVNSPQAHRIASRVIVTAMHTATLACSASLNCPIITTLPGCHRSYPGQILPPQHQTHSAIPHYHPSPAVVPCLQLQARDNVLKHMQSDATLKQNCTCIWKLPFIFPVGVRSGAKDPYICSSPGPSSGCSPITPKPLHRKKLLCTWRL